MLILTNRLGVSSPAIVTPGPYCLTNAPFVFPQRTKNSSGACVGDAKFTKRVMKLETCIERVLMQQRNITSLILYLPALPPQFSTGGLPERLHIHTILLEVSVSVLVG